MGGTSLPTAQTPGYTLYKKRVTCTCMAQWLDAAERLGLARGLIKFNLDLVQLTGGNPLSGNTHSKGGAADLKQRSDAWIALFREMGAAAWRRDGKDWENNEHCHLVIPCPHNGPAAYQLTACKRGYNGLGQAKTGTYAGQWGYGGKDPHPAPKTWRSLSAGIAWAEAEIAKLKQNTDTKEDDMPTPKDLWNADIITSPDREASNPTWAPASYLRETFRLVRVVREENRAQTAALTAAIQALAASKGQDGDAIVAAVERQVAEALKDVKVELTVGG